MILTPSRSAAFKSTWFVPMQNVPIQSRLRASSKISSVKWVRLLFIDIKVNYCINIYSNCKSLTHLIPMAWTVLIFSFNSCGSKVAFNDSTMYPSSFNLSTANWSIPSSRSTLYFCFLCSGGRWKTRSWIGLPTGLTNSVILWSWCVDAVFHGFK